MLGARFSLSNLFRLRTHGLGCVRHHKKSDGVLDLGIGRLIFVIIRQALWCAVVTRLSGSYELILPAVFAMAATTLSVSTCLARRLLQDIQRKIGRSVRPSCNVGMDALDHLAVLTWLLPLGTTCIGSEGDCHGPSLTIRD